MRTRIGRRPFAALIGSLLVATSLGAGLGATPAGASATNTTCAALTRDQVSTALSIKAGAPKASTVRGVDTCTWTTKSGVKVTYSVHPLTDATRADLERLGAEDRHLVVAGVGDKSIVQCTKGGPTAMECERFGKLSVLHGDQVSLVTVTGLPKRYRVENQLTGILTLGRNSQGEA